MRILFIVLCFLLNCSVYGKTINDFSLPIFGENKTFQLSKSLKDKKVVINFWASWCTSCIKELPELEKLKKDNPDVMFVAVNAGEKKKKIKKFLKEYDFSYLILMDKDKSFSKSNGVLSLPQTMVIGKNGEIEYFKEVPPKKL